MWELIRETVYLQTIVTIESKILFWTKRRKFYTSWTSFRTFRPALNRDQHDWHYSNATLRGRKILLFPLTWSMWLNSSMRWNIRFAVITKVEFGFDARLGKELLWNNVIHMSSHVLLKYSLLPSVSFWSLSLIARWWTFRGRNIMLSQRVLFFI
jgi:hypothetical protein